MPSICQYFQNYILNLNFFFSARFFLKDLLYKIYRLWCPIDLWKSTCSKMKTQHSLPAWICSYSCLPFPKSDVRCYPTSSTTGSQLEGPIHPTFPRTFLVLQESSHIHGTPAILKNWSGLSGPVPVLKLRISVSCLGKPFSPGKNRRLATPCLISNQSSRQTDSN